jgi:hypothetical protein
MRPTRSIVAAGLALAGALPAAAQSLSARVQQAPADRTVVFAYEAKPGVCGDGENIVNIGDEDARYIDLRNGERAIVTRNGTHVTRSGRCDFGPVRIEIERAGRTIAKLRARVGAQTALAGAVDLGTVTPAEATRFLLENVARGAARKAADTAIFAATLGAGMEPWTQLLALARDERIASRVRKSAVFWVSQAAGASATDGLREVVDSNTDIEVRESAIFALSQRPADEGVPALIAIVRTSPEPKLRKSAIFWLGQSEDPRALALFEELLIKP